MMSDCDEVLIRVAEDFPWLLQELAGKLERATPYDRGEVHAQQLTDPKMVTSELRHVRLVMPVPSSRDLAHQMTGANLPWAEDHFRERMSGHPLNPPPSEAYWPFAQAGNEAHKKDGGFFSHTYPERFWPKFADGQGREGGYNHGIKFEYGDFNDLIEVLRKNPKSRQAYLPIWFPEDLVAAREGKRVPCTLGYHFLLGPFGMDIVYHIRSCDFLRHFPDDVYMAMRLLQVVLKMLGDQEIRPNQLIMNIGSLHVFKGDMPRIGLMAHAGIMQSRYRRLW